MTRWIPRLALPILLCASPLHAWQAGAEGAICTLDHSGADAKVRLTYDPSVPRYSISIRTAVPWPETDGFAIRFEGQRGITISTIRHVLSDGGRSLTVTDRGFGNVLNGLEFNTAAIAIAGDRRVAIDLSGAAPEVAAFRACATMPMS